MFHAIFAGLLLLSFCLGCMVFKAALPYRGAPGGGLKLISLLLCGLLLAAPFLAWLWYVPVERLLTSRALDAYLEAQEATVEVSRKSFIKDFKNGGTLILVEYDGYPGRIHYYRYPGFGRRLTLESVKTSVQP